jgi:hypothetical protein
MPPFMLRLASLICPTFLQLVQPAFHKVLSYLRGKALEKFKSDLNLLLENGKGFAASVRESTESSVNEFDQGCAGKIILFPDNGRIVSRITMK